MTSSYHNQPNALYSTQPFKSTQRRSPSIPRQYSPTYPYTMNGNNEAGPETISRATSVSRASKHGTTASRAQSLIKKNVAPHDLQPSDILIERFVGWKAIVKQLIAYFEVREAAGLSLDAITHTCWFRVSQTLRTTSQESSRSLVPLFKSHSGLEISSWARAAFR